MQSLTKSPKFIVDIGVGRSVEKALKELNLDVISVWDIDPKAKDSEILRLAEFEKRIIITMDKDFGELVYNGRLNHSGVLLLRLESATGEEKAGIIKIILKDYLDMLYKKFCVYQNGKFRIKS
jgi:predicted nuclease of predicted toxin-antitoxin system